MKAYLDDPNSLNEEEEEEEEVEVNSIPITKLDDILSNQEIQLDDPFNPQPVPTNNVSTNQNNQMEENQFIFPQEKSHEEKKKEITNLLDDLFAPTQPTQPSYPPPQYYYQPPYQQPPYKQPSYKQPPYQPSQQTFYRPPHQLQSIQQMEQKVNQRPKSYNPFDF